MFNRIVDEDERESSVILFAFASPSQFAIRVPLKATYGAHTHTHDFLLPIFSIFLLILLQYFYVVLRALFLFFILLFFHLSSLTANRLR